MAIRREHWISLEEYLKIDRASPDVKYEYMDGHIYAMAGGTRNHARVAMNLGTIIDTHLGDRPCRAYSSDVRVQVSESKYFFPDLTVTCSSEDMRGDEDIIYFPRLIVEVLSPSTETRDRGKKFKAYQKCPSVEEYVLIKTECQEVEIYNRQGDIWTYRQFGPGQEVELLSISLTIPIAALYSRTDVPEQEPD